MKRINENQWADSILILGFVLIISIPMIFTFIGEKEVISTSEKRRLASLPSLSARSLLNADYQRDFDKFYEDHFGFRQKILDSARRFRRAFWNKSISRHVFYGKDGWLFFNIDGSIHDFTGYYTQIESDIDPLLDGLVSKKQWLDQLGVRYLLVPIPGKMSIYPEYLPDRVKRAAGLTRLKAFMKRIPGTELEETVLDLLPVLEKAKSENQTYFKTDTHWNERGAFAVYVATINKLTQWFSELEPIASDRLTIVARKKRGDIAIADGARITDAELSESLIIDTPCASRDYVEQEYFKKTPAFQAYPKALPVANGCASKSIKALVVHDSFGAYLMQFLSDSFGEVIFMSSYDVYGMKSFIEEYDPDVYIDFRVDRRFHLLLGTDSRMQSDLIPAKEPQN